MVTEFSLSNESESREWDDYVGSHPDGTPFHLTSWMRIIRETYTFEPILYVHKGEGKKIMGVCPFFIIKSLFRGTRIVSNPFSDYCGPITGGADIEKEILDKIAREKGRTARYIEIRQPLLPGSGYVMHNNYAQPVLELNQLSGAVFKNFDKRTIQRSIKKAEKEGVHIREENTMAGMEEFFRLNKLTRKKHGVPSQPRRFFESLFRNMVANGLAFILLAEYDSKVISSGIFLKFNNTIYYKYNASDPAYLASKTPNHLLTWHAIKKGCEEGCRKFDFGRSLLEDKGLIRHKRMWGAMALELPYYYFPVIGGSVAKEGNGFMYRMATGVWKVLPDRITDMLSPIIMKQIA